MEISKKKYKIISYNITSDTLPANYKKYKYSARLPYGEEITNSICEYCGFKK